jgi:hypothetical protein
MPAKPIYIGSVGARAVYGDLQDIQCVSRGAEQVLNALVPAGKFSYMGSAGYSTRFKRRGASCNILLCPLGDLRVMGRLAHDQEQLNK